MRTIDPETLWRSTVGFDRVFDLLDEARRSAEETYPPYDIVRNGDNHYEITLALAGFGADEIAITAEQNVLTVEGKKARREQQQYLYQGISSRPFRRSFRLAEHVQVKGAAFDNGLLKIALVREIPEAMKPRTSPSTAHGADRTSNKGTPPDDLLGKGLATRGRAAGPYHSGFRGR
jgi:molecular chaperone IbpA